MQSDYIEFLKSVDSPTLINAIETLKLRPHRDGFTPLEVRCLFPELGRMCGYAVTAHVESVTQCGPFEIERFLDLYRALEAAPKPAVVVLQEIGGHGSFAAHAGEVMSTFFQRLGAVGLLSDCGVRDLPEVRRLGFHYFARGSVASHANYRIVQPNVPVQILGMEVRPGDLIHGDENGVITVPAGLEDRLQGAVENVRERERKVMDFVRGKEFSLDRFLGVVVE